MLAKAESSSTWARPRERVTREPLASAEKNKKSKTISEREERKSIGRTTYREGAHP